MRRKRAAPLPPTTLIRRRDTHRLIPSRYSDARDPLESLVADAAQLADLAALSNVTDERLLGENGLLAPIGIHELAFGPPHAHIVNAAFIHAHPLGSRFNSADRGAWYAAFQLSTAQAEVVFHKTVHLAEVGRYEDDVQFDDYLADFNGEFHDLRRAKRFAACLSPTSYVASQALAEKLLERGSLGVVYPSVRRARGTCLACFDPKSVGSVEEANATIRWRGDPTPEIDVQSDSRRL